MSPDPALKQRGASTGRDTATDVLFSDTPETEQGIR